MIQIDDPILVQEIIDVSKKLKDKKGSATDSINDRIVNEYIGTHFRQITQHSILPLHGYFPQIWSEGFIVPIHKSGDKMILNNYRGISIRSFLGTFFTLIVNSRQIVFRYL